MKELEELKKEIKIIGDRIDKLEATDFFDKKGNIDYSELDILDELKIDFEQLKYKLKYMIQYD